MRIRKAQQRGFTLVELMVVVAIVGVLVVVAVLSLDPDDYSKSVKGYSEQVTATLENVRVRATASQKWQRIEVNGDSVVHMEAEEPGMGEPDAYYVVRTLTVPRGVRIASVKDSTETAPGDPPDDGDGLGSFIDFAPDGSGSKATIYIEDDDSRTRYRIAVFRATGLARLFSEW